eukprot:IDg9179t1
MVGEIVPSRIAGKARSSWSTRSTRALHCKSALLEQDMQAMRLEVYTLLGTSSRSIPPLLRYVNLSTETAALAILGSWLRCHVCNFAVERSKLVCAGFKCSAAKYGTADRELAIDEADCPTRGLVSLSYDIAVVAAAAAAPPRVGVPHASSSLP